MVMLNGDWVTGDWIQTFTGKQFWPLAPAIDAIDITDIAHALSMQCRYGGHSKHFYSVAEHSYHVSQHVPPEDALWGLLHDATEAYLVDVPRPVKKFLAGYEEIETDLMAAICKRFDLPVEMPASVHRADNMILMDERCALLTKPPANWNEESAHLGVNMRFWGPREAELRFLTAFERLTYSRG